MRFLMQAAFRTILEKLKFGYHILPWPFIEYSGKLLISEIIFL